MKSDLERLLREALRTLVPEVLAEPVDPAQVVVERARDPQHGDFASNIAMRIAKAARKNPRDLAQAIIQALPKNDLISSAEPAGAGFINFRLVKGAWYESLAQVAALGERYGRSDVGAGRKIMVEFVSANPTGPMHVGHGRGAAYGATLSNLLEATGHSVYREYYINDAGRQIDILAVSVYLRYLELAGVNVPFPSNGYKAGYILPVAQALHAKRGDVLKRDGAELTRDVPPDAPAGDKDKHIDGLISNARRVLGAEFDSIVLFARDAMLADIRNDLDEFRVTFDHWYSERELNQKGAVDHALAELRKSGRVYEKEGALWFKSTEYGDDEDRVVVRANGEKTYFASDIAYHFDKRQRGHDLLIDVWGADHHGYVSRVRGALQALGAPGDCFEVCLMQLVSLFRGGERLAMGKREGNFVTLRDLRNEVGNDAARFFYIMRSHDQSLDFDLELAKSRSHENPVYYVQYAHARVCSVMKELGARGYTYDAAQGAANLALLTNAHEQAVITEVSKYPELIRHAALSRTPHAVVHYLRDLANSLHTYYNAEKWIVEDAAMRNARITLVLAVQQVVRNGLGILGVSAPESM